MIQYAGVRGNLCCVSLSSGREGHSCRPSRPPGSKGVARDRTPRIAHDGAHAARKKGYSSRCSQGLLNACDHDRGVCSQKWPASSRAAARRRKQFSCEEERPLTAAPRATFESRIMTTLELCLSTERRIHLSISTRASPSSTLIWALCFFLTLKTCVNLDFGMS